MLGEVSSNGGYFFFMVLSTDGCIWLLGEVPSVDVRWLGSGSFSGEWLLISIRGGLLGGVLLGKVPSTIGGWLLGKVPASGGCLLGRDSSNDGWQVPSTGGSLLGEVPSPGG